MSLKAGLFLAALILTRSSHSEERLRYRYNGLDVQATYARGVEATRLVGTFIETTPRGLGRNPGSWRTQGSWRQLAVIDEGISRVLQVRGEGEALEAIASALDTTQLPHREDPAPLWLPPASVLTSEVQFLRPTASTQWVFRSAWNPESLATWLRMSARVRGWTLASSGSRDDLHLTRAAERLRVHLLPQSSAPLSGSVIVMTRWGAL